MYPFGFLVSRGAQAWGVRQKNLMYADTCQAHFDQNIRSGPDNRVIDSRRE